MKKSKKHNSSSQKRNLFLPTSRLNISQRKYCKCLMSVRRSGKNPYPICISALRSTNRVNFNKTTNSKKTKKSKKQFNPTFTNCMLNYDFTKFDLKDIQNLAKERKITISYVDKNKKRKEYKKETLIHKLTSNYLKNKVKTNKKTKSKNTKNTKNTKNIKNTKNTKNTKKSIK